MKNVRMKSSFVGGPAMSLQAGHTYELPDDQADRLVGAGHALMADDQSDFDPGQFVNRSEFEALIERVKQLEDSTR